MVKKVRSLLYKYFTLGADENNSDTELKKIILLHIFCNTWHLFTVFSFIEDFLGDQLMLLSYPIMFSLVFTVQVLLSQKKTMSASIMFVISLIGVTLFYSNYLYVAELMEYYLLIPPAISLIYIDNRKVNIFILILCLAGLYIPNLYFKHYPISVLNNMNPPFLFFSIYIVVSYFKNLNVRNEKKLEAKTNELEELDKFKSQFFTNISHEIRTPLTLINGKVSELKEYTVSNPAISAIQVGIQEQINVITDMVNNVLDLTKMQSSEFRLQLKPVNVSELLRKQYLNFESLFKQKNLAFNLIEITTDYLCNADIIYLERAINNIIINALKYTEDGGVDITITNEDQSIHIGVSDTGIGITNTDMESVFNRFYQVNNDINEAGGSGIGLPFSKEIISLHGGELLLVSTIGVGSTFTLVLPLLKSQDVVISNTSTDVEKSNFLKKNIEISDCNFLIVEDNFDMRKYLISILREHNCLEASNGLEALEIMEHNTVDFIITDYMMPKMNGYDFVKKVKEKNINIPVVMLTAKTDADCKLDVLKLGIDDYLSKPFDQEELLVRIHNSLMNSRIRNSYNIENNITVNEDRNDFIEQLKLYVFERANERTLNQEMLAEKFYISKSSFYRKVKSQTGLSPNNFIKEIRLQKARQILKENPSILLKQLALEVGFSHQAYFSRIYKERFGSKPIKGSEV